MVSLVRCCARLADARSEGASRRVSRSPAFSDEHFFIYRRLLLNPAVVREDRLYNRADPEAYNEEYGRQMRGDESQTTNEDEHRDLRDDAQPRRFRGCANGD